MKTVDLTLFGFRAFAQLGRDERAEREAQYRATNNYFDGDYTLWRDALAAAGGYDRPAILQKAVAATRLVHEGTAAYERDTVVYDRAAYSHPLLAWLLYAASRENGHLRVLDFGGALGSSYHQHRAVLGHLPELRWGVVEQAHYVEAGRREFTTATLDYYLSITDCAAAIAPNFGLSSATLQYLENPYERLDELLSLGLPYVLIDRTLAHRNGGDRLAVQHVPAWIYDASYPVWLLDADRLEAAFARHGYEIIDTFDPYPGSSVDIDGFSSPYAGWFLQKRL